MTGEVINERVMEHYNRIIRDLKLVMDDPELTPEEKLRILGMIL